MEIYAKFHIDRREGKTESTENVEAALLEELQAGAIDDFDVEDSLYGVDDVDIVENPKKRTSGSAKSANLGPALWRLADAYFEARPVALDFGDEASHEKAESRKAAIQALGSAEQALDDALFHLLNQASEAIQAAKVAQYKQKGK